MNPVTHALTSWVVANTAAIERRDRALVTIAGIVPDFDGAGIIAELITRDTDKPLLWWTKFHHVLGHNSPLKIPRQLRYCKKFKSSRILNTLRP